MLTLDGVIQGPGSPEEDPSDGFTHGGWVAPYDDEASSNAMEKMLKPADLLLGRKTFEIWEHYWPKHAEYWPGINEVTKYVLSKTVNKSEWQNCVFLESIEDIKKLKNQPAGKYGADIKIWGSSKLIQLLLQHDLVDELWLMIHPLILGKGKKLFGDDSFPAAYTLTESTATPSGVIFAYYKRAGKVKTGTVGD